MRVTARAGEHCVEIRVSSNSPAMLRAAERATKRLLAALPPGPPPAPTPEPFGYCVSAEAPHADTVYGTDTDAQVGPHV